MAGKAYVHFNASPLCGQCGYMMQPFWEDQFKLETGEIIAVFSCPKPDCSQFAIKVKVRPIEVELFIDKDNEISGTDTSD